MNALIISDISTYTGILPIAIAIARRRQISPVFYPFIAFLAVGVSNDFLSLFTATYYQNNMVNSNIYILIEYYLILWQFKKWDDRAYWKYTVAALIGLIVWVLDMLVLHTILDNTSIFRVVYSTGLVLFSIDQLNRVVIYEKNRVSYNAIFLICIGFMMYFSLKAYLESFNLYSITSVSRQFYRNMWIVLNFVNVAANLIYSLAIFRIRPKKTLNFPY